MQLRTSRKRDARAKDLRQLHIAVGSGARGRGFGIVEEGRKKERKKEAAGGEGRTYISASMSVWPLGHS